MTKRVLIFFYLVNFLCQKETAYAQSVTLTCKNEKLEDIIGTISRQAKVGIVYDPTLWKNKARVSITVDSMPVSQLLDTLLSGQGLIYDLIGGVYCIMRKEAPEPDRILIKGKVTDESGEPLAYTTVSVKDGPVIKATVTDGSGRYALTLTLPVDTLVFSRVGYETRRIKYTGELYKLIKLRSKYDMLEVASVTGYEQKLPNDKIPGEYTSITNAGTSQFRRILEKIPGLIVSSTTGSAGSSYKSQFRGPSSIGVVPGISPSNDALIIIDGVPFAEHRSTLPIRSPLNDLGIQGKNILETINVIDIESITILKDAAATAIWGARGANGVIVIRTKQAKPGQDGLVVNASAGIGRITTLPKMLNARQYLEMRQEAYQNDSITSYVGVKPPDLISSDTTSYTDFRKTLMSAYAKEIDLHTSLSGRSNLFQYYISFGAFRNITLPRDQVVFDRISMHGRLTYRSRNRKLFFDLANTNTSSANRSGINELAGYLYLPPNSPQVDNDAFNTMTYTGLFKIQLKYDLTSSLKLSANLFHNKIVDDDHIVFPTGSTYAVNNAYHNWVIEPQVEYTDSLGPVKSIWVLGTTWQKISSKITSAAAESSSYNYVGFFSRAEFLYKNKYMLNLTAHRDGSGRLRAGDRFGNFGALGVGWVFYRDPYFNKPGSIINYGKLRAGYGITGNDQVDVNNYNKSWLFALNARQYNSTTLPIYVAGEDYTWQVNRKLDLGIELGILKNRVSLCLDLYRSRAGNQVIAYPEPSMGINAVVVKNSSVVIENKGLELSLQVKDSRLGVLKWYANMALTFPDNRLVSFPGLSTSLYANKLVVGKSVLIQQGYHFTGVSPETGLFQVADLDKDGRITPDKDYRVFGDLKPTLLGNMLLGLGYKRWELRFLLEGRRQNGYSLLYQVYANAIPGADMVNVPVDFLNRWRKPGDHSTIQRLSAMNSAATRNAISNYVESDARLTNASYLRLKFVQLYYDLVIPVKLNRASKKLGMYLNADNLLTLTKYKGIDPETQNIFTFPAQMMLSAGLRFSL